MRICLSLRLQTGCGEHNDDGARYCRGCGRPLAYALRVRDPGEEVNGFAVEALIGHGGYGAVYRARGVVDGRAATVALKETLDVDEIAPMQREFAILSALQRRSTAAEYAHLPQYHAMFEAEDFGYLVMEYVAGLHLGEVCRQYPGNRVPATVALGYALQVCAALEVLHRHDPPIYHRDIKPANIRLTPLGQVKLVDFGLLKAGSGLTGTSRRGLTAMFAPPEQFSSGQGMTDARSDIYSLAATIHALVTGELPAAAGDRMATTVDPLRAAHEVCGDVPEALGRVLLAGMALQKEQRPPDVARFRQLLMGLPVPEPTPATPRLDRAGAEYRWVPAGAGLEGFWVMRTPVTNALWRAAVQAGAVPEPRRTDAYNDAAKAQHPVVNVTREQARTYAAWVGGRLPRDAEWTRAAQGDDGRKWPWGDTPPDAMRANCRPHGPGDTTPVGAYPAGASPYGLLDMAGNVWERVEPDDGDDRRYIVRGGAFDYNAVSVVCGARYERGNDYNYLVGFRVVSPGL
jgi:serine/threonine protein kinase